MVRLTLYTRPGCQLCEDMKATVAEASAMIPVDVEEVYISTDPELERLYGLEIPVLMVGGRKVAKYRVSAAALRRILCRSAG